MSSKPEIQRKVRQRANFVCQNCYSISDCQYAHIYPEEWGGPYVESNLLFLCYCCHRKFEVSKLSKNSIQANKLIDRMYELQNSKNKVDMIRGNFEFYSDEINIRLGNGFTIINTPIIFYTTTKKLGEEIPLLTISKQNDQILLSGFFFDENHKLLLEIYNNKFLAKSNMLWDFQIKIRSYLHLSSKSTQTNIKLSQNEDGSLNLTGILYYFGRRYDLSDNFVDPQGNKFNGFIVSCCPRAIYVSESGIKAIS